MDPTTPTDYPPRMSDGRHFTDYRPDCFVNNLIRVQNSPEGELMNSYRYRIFLQQNGQQMIDKERAFAEQRNACCASYAVDPNSNDAYWTNLKSALGF